MSEGFYVTATDDGVKFARLFGPLETKADAEACVDSVKRLACKIDASGRAYFKAWGVCKITSPNALPAARLNTMVGVQ